MITRYGVLVRDPELRYSGSGLAMCFLLVKSHMGNYVRLVAFDEVAEDMMEHLGKEDEIFVTGYFKDRTWEGKNGVIHGEKEFIVKNWKLRT